MPQYPRGVETVVGSTLGPGEQLVAATYADNYSGTDTALSMIFGEAGVKLARKAGARDEVPPLPGLAGTIYRGEVLVAVTNQRVLVFPRENKAVHPQPTWFEPGAVVHVYWARAVLGAPSLDLRFGDQTYISLSLPSKNHGKHVEKAAQALLAGGGTY